MMLWFAKPFIMEWIEPTKLNKWSRYHFQCIKSFTCVSGFWVAENFVKRIILMKKVKMLKFCLQYLLYSIVLKNLAWESKMFIIQNLLNITDIVHSNKILWNCNKNINFGNMRFFHVQLFSNQIIQNSWQTFRSIRVNGERICGMNDYHTRKTRKKYTQNFITFWCLYIIYTPK